MGKLNIGGGSPLRLQFEDDAGNPIETVQINGTTIQANHKGWFETDIMTERRQWHGNELNVFRVTEIRPQQATIEYRTEKA